MTLAQAIKITLNRLGLNATASANMDQARFYLSTVGKRFASELGGRWWFLHKSSTFSTTQTVTATNVSGTFVSGETVTGSSSGATGVVDSAYDATNYPTALLFNSITGTFTVLDIPMTGGVSGATASYLSVATTQTYALASDVLVPHSFVDVSNDRTISGSGLDLIDADDPDRDYETDSRMWAPDGIDSLTGKTLVRLYPYHDTPGDTIRYRYRGFITDWASSDDSTSMNRWFPEFIQPAIWYGACELYFQEKGDTDAAKDNRFEYEAILKAAKETNRTIWGNRNWQRNALASRGVFDYVPADGSLTAAS